MTIESQVRVLAGTLILAGLVLGHFVSPHFLWVDAFVGANLIQSAFTGFCPAEIILRKVGGRA